MTLDAGSSDVELLVVTATDFEAQTKAAVLRDAGIECTVTLDASRREAGSSSLTPSSRGAAILVRSGDLDAAKRILAEAADVDWEATDFGDDPTTSDGDGNDDDGATARRARMPVLARVGWVVAAVIVLGSLLIAILTLVFG